MSLALHFFSAKCRDLVPICVVTQKLAVTPVAIPCFHLRVYHCLVISPHSASSPAPTGFLKVNCDGAWDKASKEAGYGVVIRDHRGRLVDGLGLARHFFAASPLQVELQAILDGIRVASSKGYRSVTFESNSKLSIELSRA